MWSGADTTLHHLSGLVGTQDPLFSKAVLQSTAYQLFYDRKGTLEQNFQTFAALASCAKKGVACLRNANTTSPQNAISILSRSA